MNNNSSSSQVFRNNDSHLKSQRNKLESLNIKQPQLTGYGNFMVSNLNEEHNLLTLKSRDQKSPGTSIKKQMQSISPKANTTISLRKGKAAESQGLQFKKELQKEVKKNQSKSPPKNKAKPINQDIDCENILIANKGKPPKV